MDLRIKRIVNGGDYNGERVVISVRNTVDIGQFILACTRRLGDSISSKIRNPLWFPDQEMNEGDLVVVYSKKGVKWIKENEDGTRTYFLYWNHENSVWNNGDIPVLLKIGDWTTQQG